jgi:uncharacterized protein
MAGFSLPVLNSRFRSSEHFRSAPGYQLLPMRFASLDHRYVVTNMVGERVLLSRQQLQSLIEGSLSRDDPSYFTLLSKHFLLESNSRVALDLLAAKYRTQQQQLAEFTGLHIFVVTLRCDHSCPYCQVSRVSSDRAAFDMTPDTADRAIELVFRSPNRRLKIEFQGGEPLLNFDVIRHIVDQVELRNQHEGRVIDFVIATNLANLTDEMLTFCQTHRVFISTSLDGPAELHNANRPRPGNDSYERAVNAIGRCRAALGHDSVSALMTTTRRSLAMPEAIIDEYVAQGFSSVFLRWLSPFGFAVKTHAVVGYGVEEWKAFFERGLRHIIRLNQMGTQIREDYCGIVLRKMLTPFPTGYVDLRSPTGLCIAVLVYNYDGQVYASDESRMLAENGDFTFRLGHVAQNAYEDIMGSARLLDIVSSTMTEGIPQCCDCAFEPYCGTDPVLHHATQGDMVGHRPTSAFCERNMFVFKLLVTMLEDEPATRDILERWV